MMYGHPLLTFVTLTILSFIRISNPVDPPSKVLCIDEHCTKSISEARILKTTRCHGGDSLKKVSAGKTAIVFAKSVDSTNSFWGIEVDGARCFIDRSLLKEKKGSNTKPTVEVPNPLPGGAPWTFGSPKTAEDDDTETDDDKSDTKKASSSQLAEANKNSQKSNDNPDVKSTDVPVVQDKKQESSSKGTTDDTETEDSGDGTTTAPPSTDRPTQPPVSANQLPPQPATTQPSEAVAEAGGKPSRPEPQSVTGGSSTVSPHGAKPEADAGPQKPGSSDRVGTKVESERSTPDLESPKESSQPVTPLSPSSPASTEAKDQTTPPPKASPTTPPSTMDPWLSSSRSKLLQCIRRISDNSYLLTGLLHFLEVVRMPGTAIVSFFPKSTVQSIDTALAITGLNLELFIVAALCFFYILLLSLLFQCCLCRRNFKADLSKRHDLIASLEDKVSERDQVNAKLSESNVALTKKVKELERVAQEGRRRQERECEDQESERVDLERRLAGLQVQLEAAEAERVELEADKAREMSEQRSEAARAAKEAEERLRAKEEEIRRLQDITTDLQENQKRLMEQTTTYYESMTQMQQEAEKITSDRDRLEQGLLDKDNELAELRQSFQYLKALEAVVEEELNKQLTAEKTAVVNSKKKKEKGEDDDEEEDEDDEDDEDDEEEEEEEDSDEEADKAQMEKRRDEIQQTKLAEFLNVSQMRSEMQNFQERCQLLENKLRVEEEGRADLETRLDEMKRQNASLQTSRLEAEERQKVAQNKLDILSQYFKEREAEMQRNMGEQEILKNQSANQMESHRSRAELLEMQTTESRRQLEEMQQELQEQERAMRRQLSELEKRAFDNWKASRASEREVKELKEENLSLRHRLAEADRARASAMAPAQAVPGRPGGPLAASSPPPFIPPPPPPPMPFLMRPGNFPPPNANPTLSDSQRPTSRQSGGNESELSRSGLDARPPSRSSASQSLPSGVMPPPMPPIGLPPGMRLPPPPNFPPMPPMGIPPGMMPPPPFMVPPPPRGMPPPPSMRSNGNASRPPR